MSKDYEFIQPSTDSLALASATHELMSKLPGEDRLSFLIGLLVMVLVDFPEPQRKDMMDQIASAAKHNEERFTRDMMSGLH